jgi:signal transduction histidine kinase
MTGDDRTPATIPFLSPAFPGYVGARPPGVEALATLAHELRNPLAAILYALEAIPDGRDGDPATRRARTIAKRQARRAVPIVDDLFDVCAGARGKLPLRHEWVVPVRRIT